MLEIELEAVGIRLNTTPPDVVFRQKSAGGITVCPFSFTLTYADGIGDDDGEAHTYE
jgi:ribosome-interacting GTPase 1